MLNQREILILQMVADGEGNRRIAADVKVSYKYLRQAMMRIRRKLGAPRTENAVATALRRGLID